jgi:tRNA(adenine34) deaminase
MDTEHERFMRMALEEAARARREGNMAVGSVIVRDGQVLSQGHNEAVTTFDVTAHAETVVIRKLSMRLKVVNPSSRADRGPLAGCTLYTTVEPCPMCCWAICVSGISTLVVGARFAQMGVRYGAYAIERLIAMTEQNLALISGVLGDECARVRLGEKS